MQQKIFRSTLFIATTLLGSGVFAGQAFAQSTQVSGAEAASKETTSIDTDGVKPSPVVGSAVQPDATARAVVKCVAADGHVTLTDAACPSNSETAKLDAPLAKALATEHYKLPAAEVHHKSWTATPTPRKPSPDVATLKAARETMLMAQSSRQQRLAGLN